MKKFLIYTLLIFSFIPYSIHAETISSSNIFELVNNERVENGLSALSLNPTLTLAAQNKANDLVSKGYFDHTSPAGVKFYEWIENAGYPYFVAGENLAVNTNSMSNTAIVDAWMNSPSHRENILSSRYSETGIAIAYGTYQNQQAVFVVQTFATPLPVSNSSIKTTTTPAENKAPIAIAEVRSAVSSIQPAAVSKSKPELVTKAVVSSEISTSTEDTNVSSDEISKQESVETKSLINRILLWLSNIFTRFI
jgi:hypothetical protein